MGRCRTIAAVVVLMIASSCAAPAFASTSADWAYWESQFSTSFFNEYLMSQFTPAQRAAMQARGIVDARTFWAKAKVSEVQWAMDKLQGQAYTAKPGQWLYQATAARDGAAAQGIHRAAGKALPWTKGMTVAKIGGVLTQASLLFAAHDAGNWISDLMFGEETYYHADGSTCGAYDSWGVCLHPGEAHYLHRQPGWLMNDAVDQRYLFPGFLASLESSETLMWDFPVNYQDMAIRRAPEWWARDFQSPPHFQENPYTYYGISSTSYMRNGLWSPKLEATKQRLLAVLSSPSSPIYHVFYSSNDAGTWARPYLYDQVTGAKHDARFLVFDSEPSRNENLYGAAVYVWDGYTQETADARCDQLNAWLDTILGNPLITPIHVTSEQEIDGRPEQAPAEESRYPAVLEIPGSVHDQLTDPDSDPIASEVIEQVQVPDTLPDPVEQVTGVDEDENRWTGKTAPLIGTLQGEFAQRWPFAGGVVMASVWESAQGGSADPMTWQVQWNPFAGSGVPGTGLFAEPVYTTIDPRSWLAPLVPYRWVLVGMVSISAIATLFALLRPKVAV